MIGVISPKSNWEFILIPSWDVKTVFIMHGFKGYAPGY